MISKEEEIVNSLKTEMDCFELLEMIGMTNFSYRHNVMDGRLKSDAENDQAAAALYDIQTLIVRKLEQEFGVIFLPREAEADMVLAPGQREYWSWYERMREEYREREHKKTLCSACPYCKEKGERYDDQVPCSVFPGYATGLFRPWECLMLRETIRRQSREDFLRGMEEKAGADAVNVFRQKELRLKLIWSREQIASYKRAFEKYSAAETGHLLKFVVFLVENNFLSEAAGFIDHLTEGYPDYFTVYPRMNELRTIREKIEG